MKRQFKQVLKIIFLLLPFTIIIENIGAYDLKSHKWRSDPNMKVAVISFPSGSVWRDDLEYGVGRWNGMWGMWCEFDLTYSSYSSFNNSDGDNNVAFVSNEDIDGNWGLTVSRYSGSERKESDITFNADISWRTEVQDERIRNTDKPSFLKVVVHEFGHCVGLNHFDTELSIMSQGYDGHLWYGGCSNYRQHPMPDDCQGARLLYPSSNTEEDVTLTNFEMSGSSSTQIWRSNSTVTTVSPGNNVNVEYTVCNVGNVGINFSLGVYISTNDNITKYDTYIGGFSYYLPAHYAWERDKTFTIPSSFSSGTYYIGVVADPDNKLAETRECNNNLIFPGQWTVR
jgi:hypothetical protein